VVVVVVVGWSEQKLREIISVYWATAIPHYVSLLEVLTRQPSTPITLYKVVCEVRAPYWYSVKFVDVIVVVFVVVVVVVIQIVIVSYPTNHFQ